MKVKLLICTDLDRTLIPNGKQPESPQVRATFAQLIAHPGVTVAYVTGRHQALVEAAIAEYQLPTPDFAITDVGAALYKIEPSQWHPHQGWQSHIAADWQSKTSADISHLFADLEALTLQEPEKQNLYKLSYYYPLEQDVSALVKAVHGRLTQHQIAATIITSVDEAIAIGLLDILPQRASKLQAIEYLMAQEGYSLENTLFAGDSGNDLSVLTSPIKSVLVANARSQIKQEATQLAATAGNADSLYIAQGHWLGLNGNYSAGILEGAAYYFPEVDGWLRKNA